MMGSATIPYWNLTFKKQFRSFGKEQKEGMLKIRGFDTEATEDATLRVLANSAEHNVLYPDYRQTFEFLFNKGRNHINFFWNIDYDVSIMLKDFCLKNQEYIEEANKKKLGGTFELKAGRFDITYMPKKAFIIKCKNKTVKFFDICQFYNRTSLQKMSELYLNEKVHKLKTKRDCLDNYSDDEVTSYCIDDAKKTLKLSQRLVDAYRREGITTNNYLSTAYMAGWHADRTCQIPILYDAPRSANVLGYNAYIGGWKETYAKGQFDNVYLYDIISAYPACMKKLPDYREGKWHHFTGDDFDEKSPLGFMRVFICNKLNELPAYPFPIKKSYQFPNIKNPLIREGMNYYPHLEQPLQASITFLEYISLKKVYDIDVIDGIEFTPDENCSRPFEPYIKKWYSKKKSSLKGSIEYLLAKLMQNSLYGKTAQKNIGDDGEKSKTSKMFLPIYASYITAFCRINVFEACMKMKPNEILSVMTDGIITTRKIPGLSCTGGLGSWETEKAYDAIIAGDGLYRYETEDKVISKFRGYATKHDLKDNITNNRPYITLNQPKKIYSSIREHKLGNIARFMPVKKIIDFNNYQKRHFSHIKEFKDLGQSQFYSKPLVYPYMV